MEQVEEAKRKISFAPAITFLCLEILAIVGFSLGNSVILFGCLGLVLAVLFVVFYRKQIKTDEITSFAYFILPIFVSILLTVVGSYAKYDLSIADRIFIPIAFAGFAVAGYLSSYSVKFNVKTTMIVVYSAIALYTLINLFVTMTQFVPFYPIIYSNGTIYYDGAPSEVTLSSMAYALMGFKFTEVTIGYYSLFPTILFSASIALLFIDFKKDKVNWFIFLAFAVIGFISLLFTISKVSLIGDIIVVVVLIFMILFGKRKIHGKFFKIVSITVSVIAGILFIVMFLNSQTWSWVAPLQNALKNNGLLNKIFNSNVYAAKYKAILADLFTKNKLFGFPNGAELYIYVGGTDQIAYQSGSWFFDSFLTSGIFGALLFFIGLGVGANYMVKYFKYAKDNMLEKMLLLTFVSTYFAYSLFNNDGLPFIFFNNSQPIFSQGLFLIVIFFMSYMCNRAIKEAPKKEKAQNEEAKA